MQVFGADLAFSPIDEVALLQRVNSLRDFGVAPFANATVSMLGHLSRLLLETQEAKRYPQFVALGYWLRPAMLQRMKQQFMAVAVEGEIATCRGLALHLPPQNVDTLFVYSWALSVLAGNANIVRMPSEMSPQVELLSRLIGRAMRESGESERHIFCSYDHTTDLTGKISAACDLRMIWGGDEKVLSVSRDPIRPDGLSLGFPDRQSLAVISASHYSALDSGGRDTLAAQFYNDIYWFDQMGCGSPRVICWVGAPSGDADDLYQRIAVAAQKKGYGAQAALSISKFVHMNSMVADGTAASGRRFSPLLDVLNAPLSSDLPKRFHGGGMLASVWIDALTDITRLVNHATQSITHFGFTKADLRDLALALVGRGGFRLVPVGEALAFQPVWDGVPLLQHMTRVISWRS